MCFGFDSMDNLKFKVGNNSIERHTGCACADFPPNGGGGHRAPCGRPYPPSTRPWSKAPQRGRYTFVGFAYSLVVDADTTIATFPACCRLISRSPQTSVRFRCHRRRGLESFGDLPIRNSSKSCPCEGDDSVLRIAFRLETAQRLAGHNQGTENGAAANACGRDSTQLILPSTVCLRRSREA